MDKKRILQLQLNKLAAMNLAELQNKFLELFGFETKMVASLTLRNRLAYRLQEIYLGTLTQEDKDYLRKLVQDQDTESPRHTAVTMTPGVRLSREWQGKRYEVIIAENGNFECEGKLYKSLSAVARSITGTRWNGKLFFGVKK